MTFFDTFSKRKRKEKERKKKDMYQYDELPKAFRIQVLYILKESIGPYIEKDLYSYDSTDYIGTKYWTSIEKNLAKEYGRFALGEGNNPAIRCMDFILNAKTDEVLDIIEHSFDIINNQIPLFHQYRLEESKITQNANQAIKELNHRFREHRIGYQFEHSQILKVDSQYLHTYATRPTIALLHDRGFDGAEEEFLSAHEHFKNGRYKEAIADAGKSLESVLKTIHELRRWEYSKNATAAPLIQSLFEKELIPKYLQDEFTGLLNVIKSGVPTMRNKISGHGQGVKAVKTPEYIATYVLHMCASTIVFLVQAHLNENN